MSGNQYSLKNFINSNKSILVTGIPRSGTSWVGRMISQAPYVRYVHEPFNISGNLCSCGVNFNYWFQYINSENCHKYSEHLKHTIYPAYSRIGLFNTFREVIKTKRIRSFSNYFQAYSSRRVIVKDPLAVFSAVTLANMFDMNIVVLIRHPAAIVSSYKALNWMHPFSHFLSQPELMEEHLAPFRDEISDFAKNQYDIVDQIALLWKLVHYMIIKYQEKKSDWIYVRYKDLALEPLDGYQNIFQKIGLQFSDHIRDRIQAHSLLKATSSDGDPYAIKQIPYQVIYKWQKTLTSDEINRIQKRVEDISTAFFSDKEWKV